MRILCNYFLSFRDQLQLYAINLTNQFQCEALHRMRRRSKYQYLSHEIIPDRILSPPCSPKLLLCDHYVLI